MSREYRDVLVRIEGSGAGYEVSLHHFPLPQDGSLSPIVCAYTSLPGTEARRLKKLLGDMTGTLPSKDQLQDAGKLLRKLLWPDTVCTTFCGLLERTEQEGQHLHLRLLVEAEDGQVYPWEAMCIEDEEGDTFLMLDDVFSLTRLLPGEAPLVPLRGLWGFPHRGC